MSGSRIMRNEMNNPMRQATIGTINANCNERSLASALMRRISSWRSSRFVVEQRIELRVCHHLRVVLQHLGDLLLLRRRDQVARFGLVGERKGQAPRA